MKSNEEINRELEISESSYCDEEDDVDATCDSRPLYNGIQGVTMVLFSYQCWHVYGSLMIFH